MKPKFIRFVLGTAIGLASALAPLRAQFAYVTNFSDSNVSAYTIDPATGALTAIPGSPFSAGADPVSVAVDPSGKFVYVANNAVGNIVSGFTIDPTGANGHRRFALLCGETTQLGGGRPERQVRLQGERRRQYRFGVRD